MENTLSSDALYRFGAGQDLRNRQLFESAFAEHAVLDCAQPARRLGATLTPFEGRTAIADAVFGAIAHLDTTHTVTNPRLTIDGDRAALFALVEAQHLPRDDHRRHCLLKNIYSVDLLRDDRRWVIERMAIHNVWHDGDPTVLFPGA